jgi:serine/threonine-protein kinase
MLDNDHPMQVRDVELLRRIGGGGMADVFRGVRRTGGHRIAVKVLHTNLQDDQARRRQLEYEAHAIASLRHRYIVTIRDFDIVKGQPCIIMDLVTGPSLEEHLNRLHRSGRRLEIGGICSLLKNVADALDYAHSCGIAHRNIKPSNILLRSETKGIVPGRDLPVDTEAVLADFGLATIETMSTFLSRTPAYMAPEQVLGGHADARTDVYALGVILYEMLAGQVPFHNASGDFVPVLLMQVHSEAPPIDGISLAIWDVVSRALAKEQKDRYLTAGEMVRDLKHAAMGGRLERKTIRRGAGRSARR